MRVQLLKFSQVTMLSLVILKPAFLIGAEKASKDDASSSKSLSEEMDKLTGGSTSEKFYVVQDRQSGSSGVFDISVGGGINTNSDVNLKSTETIGKLKYHAGDRFFISAAHSQVKNQFNVSATRRIDEDGIYPNVGFVKSRSDLAVGFNLIYGKARLTKDSVFYFDQYIALGGGVVEQSNTRETVKTPVMTGDLGVSFWFGRRVSLGLGAKNYRFKETRIASEGIANHVVGYATVGALLGGAG